MILVLYFVFSFKCIHFIIFFYNLLEKIGLINIEE